MPKKLTLKDINTQFIEELIHLFSIHKFTNWDELAKNITIDKIAEGYQIFTEYFPLSLNKYSLIPTNHENGKLMSIFHGNLDGLDIINNISRYSLYSDKIIVFHPLFDPNLTSADYNPINNPNQWKREFVNALYFYVVLFKWVKSGIVEIILNPFNYDKEAKEDIKLITREKFESKVDEIYSDPKVKEEHQTNLMKKFRASVFGMSDDVVKNVAREVFKDKDEEELDEVVVAVKSLQSKLPLHVEFEDSKGDLLVTNFGGSVEEVNQLCQITNSQSYTTQLAIAKQLEVSGNVNIWTKIGGAMSTLDMKYLDNVDTNFARKIRSDERLSGLRVELRGLYKILNETKIDDMSSELLLDLSDNIKTKIRQAESEFESIKRSVEANNIATVTGGSFIGAMVNETSFYIPTVVTPLAIAANVYVGSKRVGELKKTNPMSIYVDLKNRKPSFWSDLKSCIF